MTSKKKLLNNNICSKERVNMVANIVNLLSRALTTSNVQKTTALTKSSTNPFANPFVSSQNANSFNSYAKNQPVKGGYFAGYYNGKANIVGQRLFVEV